jgi:transcription initiation factor TFIIIB Brf1 subunit/transcription initiation factor TFIIB
MYWTVSFNAKKVEDNELSKKARKKNVLKSHKLSHAVVYSELKRKPSIMNMPRSKTTMSEEVVKKTYRSILFHLYDDVELLFTHFPITN